MKKIDYICLGDEIPDHLKFGFVQLYKEAFGGPPYYETYTDEEVLSDAWHPHLKDGVIILAVSSDLVVGFGCAKPVTSSPDDVRDFLREKQRDGYLPVDSSAMWYMSELGVRIDHRGRGLGYALVKQRLLRIQSLGGTHYVMRTAAEGSNSFRLYKNIGALEIPGLQNVAESAQVQLNKSQSDSRIYLYGECAQAIAKIEEIA